MLQNKTFTRIPNQAHDPNPIPIPHLYSAFYQSPLFFTERKSGCHHLQVANSNHGPR